MANKTTTFTINIDANIKDLLTKSEQAKGAIGNIFNTSNLGQSLRGDFNKLDKILTRIQNTASGPIRSDWGVENLVADFSRAGLKLDDMIAKLEDIKKDKDLRIDILGDNEVQDFQKVLDYSKKLGQQLDKNKKIQAEITRLTQEEINAKADSEAKEQAWEKAKKARSTAQGQLTRIKKAYGVENYTRDEFKDYWKTNLASYLYKSGDDFNALGKKLGFSKSLLGGNDLLDIKSILAKASPEFEELYTTKDGDKVVTDISKVNAELSKLENTLIEVNEKKKMALDFEVKNTNLTKAENAVKKTWEAYDKAAKTLQGIRDNITTNNGLLTNTFDTQDWKEFEQIAQQVNVDISSINSSSGIDKIQQKIQVVSDALDNKAVVSINNVVNQLKGLVQENDNVKKSTEDVIDVQRRENERMANVNALTNRIKMFTGFYGILNLVRRSISSAISTIKELDEQMTKMAVVTSPTISDYWKQLPQYTKRANALGTAIKEVYEADTLYYQQGLKTNQVIAVSNETMKMARIAALDAAEATDRMTSAMRGFNMEINETSAQRVNDVYSQLAAITASDVNEISVAMTKTASIAHSAGMEFETTAAFLSQIIETTRESADTAGTALKTIIARFEELKKSPSEIGEIEGEVVDANKIETALRTVGIALRDTQGQFRDLDDVFLELSSKWDSLDKNTQRYIATIAAGSRQQSRFIAMMQNYAHTTELVAKANGSAGASQKQFEKTLDSMKTKLNALKNAWDTFTMGILDSDLLKGAVSFGRGFIDVLNGIGKAADTMNVNLLGSVTRVGLLIAGLRTLGVLSRKIIPFLTGGETGFWGATIGRNTLQAGSKDLNSKQSFIQALANRGSQRRLSKEAYGFARYYGYSRKDAREYADPKKFTLNENAESSLKTKEGWANLGSGIVSFAKYAAILAAIVAAWKVLSGLIGHAKYTSEEEKIKRDKEALENYNEELKKSKDLLSNIKESRSKYDGLRSELADMVKNTTAWNDKIKENNSLVLDLISTYKELALYVERNRTTGELSISTKGWNELEKKQNRKIATQTIIAQNQERRINNNTIDKFIKDLNDEISGLGNYLSSKNSQELKLTLADDKQVSALASTFGTTDNEIREAIHAISENKAAIETTEATIQTTNQLLNEQRGEGTPSVEYAQIKGLEARQEEERTNAFYKQLSKGTTYENSSAKEILSFYGIDPDVINGRGDTEILAILKGAVNGITDINEAISKYGSDTGFWDFNRTDIAKEISQKFVEARAVRKAQEDLSGYESFASNNPLFKKFIEQGAGGLSFKEKKEILNNTNIKKDFEKWMKQNNIKGTLEDAIGFTSDNQKRESFNLVFSVSSTQKDIETNRNKIQSLNKAFLNTIGKISDNTKQFLNGIGASTLKSYFDERMSATNWSQTSYMRGANLGLDPKQIDKLEEVIRIYGKGVFADYARYLSSLEEYNKRIEKIEETFENLSSSTFLDNTSDLSLNLQANLGSIFTNAAIQTGKDAALGLMDSFNSVYEDLSLEQQQQLANLLTQFDITDTKGLKEFKKALDETDDAFGDSKDVILDLADQIWDLNNAIEKVNFTEMVSALKNMGVLINQIKNNSWEGTFTEDQKKAFILAGADKNKFTPGINGEWNYAGSEQELIKVFTNAVNTGLLDLELGVSEKIYNAQQKGLLQSSDSFNTLETKDEMVSAIETALKNLGLTDSELARLQLGENWQDLDEDSLKNLYTDLINRSGEYLTQKETTENLKSQFTEVMKHFGGLYHNATHFDNREKNIDALTALTHEITSAGLDQTNKREFDELQELLGKEIEGKTLTPEEKKKVEELAKYFTTRLSYSTAKKGFAEILSTAIEVNEKLQEIPLDTQEAFDQIDSFMKQVGMKTGNITKENAQEYADFISVIANGGEEAYMAYQGLTEKVLETNGYAIGSLIKLDGAYYDNLDSTLKDAADLLYNFGLAYFENGFLKLYDLDSFLSMLDDAGGKDKDKEVTPWENPYDWLWNITEQINKNLYQRERLERKYKLAVEDTKKSTEDLYEISKKELSNLQEQARLQSLKGQKATEEAQLLLSHYKEYAKYVSMNPLTGQVQVAYEDLDKKHWSQEQGSAFEGFVSRLTELASEIKNSNESLEEIEDEVKEIRDRGKQELIDLQNRVKDALVTEREREIETLEQVNDAISDQQSKLLEAMREEIDETRRIRENTDRQEEIEKKRQRLAYLQRDTSGANQTEILSLQDEIEKDTLSYGDALIDQSLQKMQEDNELAAEKRQEQIDIANFQLARWQESGAIWDSVGPLLEEYFNNEEKSDLRKIISSAENWQALSTLERENMHEELYNNGKLAELFNKGELANDAKQTLSTVQSYSNTMTDKITKAGVLGNKILDKGEHLNVTLKDFNPKLDDTSNKLSSLGKSVDAIYQWLQKIKLTESGSGLMGATQSLKALVTAGTTATANDIKAEYQAAAQDFVSLATGRNDLSVDEAISKVSNAIQMNKELADYLKKEYHTTDFNLVAKNLLTHAHYKGFSTGGLNTTTGPAWLDGTPSKPEYVLNADQTRAFFNLVNGIDTITKSGGTTGGGDNYFNVEVNVDEISNDYDVDRAIERVKQAILEDSQYRNVNFISGLTY